VSKLRHEDDLSAKDIENMPIKLYIDNTKEIVNNMQYMNIT